MQITQPDRLNRRRDTKEQILLVAEELIAVLGPENLSIKAIAGELGIKPPSIYTHFKGLAEIREAVFIRVYQSFSQIRSETPIAPDADPLLALRQHIYGLVDHMVANPVYMQLILRDFTARRREDWYTTQIDAQVQNSFTTVNRMLEHGTRLGVFRKIEVELYLSHIFGAALISLSWSGFDARGAREPVVPIDALKEDLLRWATAYLRC